MRPGLPPHAFTPAPSCMPCPLTYALTFASSHTLLSTPTHPHPLVVSTPGCSRVFGAASGLVDMLVTQAPRSPPLYGARSYPCPLTSVLYPQHTPPPPHLTLPQATPPQTPHLPPPTPHPLIVSTQVCSRVFGAASGLVDMLVAHIPSSKVATANKVARLYTGPQDPNSPIIQFMNSCSRSGACVCRACVVLCKHGASRTSRLWGAQYTLCTHVIDIRSAPADGFGVHHTMVLHTALRVFGTLFTILMRELSTDNVGLGTLNICKLGVGGGTISQHAVLSSVRGCLYVCCV
jgi:hypothetical protein